MARIIFSYTGKVDLKLAEDGESYESITVGDEKILWGIYSIFEDYKGEVIELSIEKVEEVDE